MSRTAEEAARACVALWVVHTVQMATHGRYVCTGPLTPDKEPSPVDEVERRLMFEYASELTESLHARAERLGLAALEVQAGFDFCANRVGWGDMQAHYTNALAFIGGRL